MWKHDYSSIYENLHKEWSKNVKPYIDVLAGWWTCGHFSPAIFVNAFIYVIYVNTYRLACLVWSFLIGY